jgi:hypothetical protein
MRSLLHIIQNIFSVFLDALAFIVLCLRPTDRMYSRDLDASLKTFGLAVLRTIGVLIRQRTQKNCTNTDGCCRGADAECHGGHDEHRGLAVWL